MRTLLRSIGLPLVGIFAFSSSNLQAQTAAAVVASARLSSGVNGSTTVRLANHVPVYADVTKLPSTPIDGSAQFSQMTLVLTRAPQVEAAFQQLLADQLNPASPRYHQWLLPAQVGELYGAAPADIDAVSAWLRSQGFTVTSVDPNRIAINFSGSARVIEQAFSTELRSFALANGESRYSITMEPSVPAAIAPLVSTIFGLSQTIHHPTSRRGEMVSAEKLAGGAAVQGKSATPDLNSSTGAHFLVSGDFNTIYDVTPIYPVTGSAPKAGYDGTGQNIAIAGVARVYNNDVALLQALEAAPTKYPNQIIPSNGTDPGAAAGATVTNNDNGGQDEATVDVNRTNGTAPGATIDLVVSGNIGSGSTYGTDGLYIAINWEINSLNDPILNISFGGCEALNGSSAVTYENGIFTTAASEGISVFVSSGDSGAAACNAFYSAIPSPQTLSVNDLCVSQYVTCVGGTEFNDTANAATYWSTTSGTGHTTALSYIPEGVWNEDTLDSTNDYADYGGGGGGVSIYMAKPTYQAGTGVPSGSFRFVPDVSFTAAGHDGYVTCLSYLGATCGSFYPFGGTSLAAPSMAGIQALLNQKLGTRQGSMNHLIYELANSSSYATAFHDTTVTSSGVTNCSTATPSICNNSTPAQTTLTGGLAGYAVTTGYDEATGWGSLDAYNFVNAVSALQTVTLTLSTGTISTGGTTSMTATVTGNNGVLPTGTVQFQSNGTNIGGKVTLSTPSSGTAATAVATSPAFTTAGTYAITAVYSGDANFAAVVSTAATLTVTTSTLPIPTFTETLTPTSITTGSTDLIAVTVSGTAGTPGGTIQFQSNGVNIGGLVNLSGGTASITSPAFTTGGTYLITAVYSGSTVYAPATSGAQTLTVVTPGITLTPSPTAISLTAGSTTGNTSIITVASTGGFGGSVALTCSVTPVTAILPGCLITTPVSVTATTPGTATLTISTVAPHATKGGLQTLGALRGFSGATLAGFLVLCLPVARRRRNWRSLMAVLFCAAAFAGLSGCGNNSTPAPGKSGGTTTGVYSVLITGTSGSITQTTNVSLTVN